MSKVRKSPSQKTRLDAHTETDILRFAVVVSGSEELARAWFVKPTPLLGNKSPQEAVKSGKSRAALGILQNVAGV